MTTDFVSWPSGWPQHKQACYGSWTEYACDLLVGPCVCRAWHQPGEFEYRGGVLYRYGEPVPPDCVRER